jgi:hypothetical protein
VFFLVINQWERSIIFSPVMLLPPNSLIWITLQIPLLVFPNALPSSFQWVLKHVPQVPNVLPSSFQWVLKHVPQVPNVFPNMVPITPHFIPYSLPKVLLL